MPWISICAPMTCIRWRSDNQSSEVGRKVSVGTSHALTRGVWKSCLLGLLIAAKAGAHCKRNVDFVGRLVVSLVRNLDVIPT